MKHVLITGASSGIGKAIAEHLAGTSEWVVWAGARRPDDLAELQSRFPDKLRPVALDVTNDAQILECEKLIRAEKNLSEFHLVNNAGIATGGPLEAIPLSDWRRIFDVNLFGLVRITQIFLPLLRIHHGRIINVGSVSGRIASPFLSIYAASKFAVRGLSDSLRRELRDFGVKVILIEPGPIKTDIWGKSLSQSEMIKRDLSAEMQKTYMVSIDRLIDGVRRVERNAAPVDWVTHEIHQALIEKNPRPYRLVGRGINTQVTLASILPTRWFDALIALGFYSKSNRAKDQ